MGTAGIAACLIAILLEATGCGTSEAAAPPRREPIQCDARARGATINEVSAWSDSWVELANTGSEPVDLRGWVLGPSDEEGQPTRASAHTFGAGTTLGPGAHLLVVGEAASSGVMGFGGLHLGCAGDAQCVSVDWSFDPTRATRLALLDASGCEVSGARVPRSPDARDEETWSRVPEGRGPFARTRPTPGRPNGAR